ncbi:RNA polymerase sigma-70 factor [Luminiphilus syltensis NOR5-1B]|uniref:RNA polymerase sigma factor n=1 Tax=Luminiphilus syltensis NOR5-1B TaxID=565045 RepID=B8KWT5_9GAMM|nr:sigma-70 family RNA polymerase sigma factor [Luminiphilus syltensis]EED34708.1 RNA polymerase sigma-70 factor [Luminiphilus syltensis NOR5-1B]
MPEDDAILMQRIARSQDRRAFAEVANRHIAPIERFATRMLGDVARAQDVTQEVMLKVWLRANEYHSGKARLTTWLHQIARNLCIDQQRATARLSAWQEQDQEQALSAVADDRGADVSGLLMLLPEAQRSALVLTYYQSLTNREAAEVMGLSVRALESLLVRARRSLKRHLEVAP